MKKMVLILEDDIDLAEGIELSLQSEELNFIICQTIADAKVAIQKQKFDLMIFDINLPDGNGVDFCRELKQKISNPIALLTAKDMELDIVKGLESGADDYITKPFSLMVLRARIRALLRRSAVRYEQEYKDAVFLFRFGGRSAGRRCPSPAPLSRPSRRILTSWCRLPPFPAFLQTGQSGSTASRKTALSSPFLTQRAPQSITFCAGGRIEESFRR